MQPENSGGISATLHSDAASTASAGGAPLHHACGSYILNT
jgi:hypothetical protein